MYKIIDSFEMQCSKPVDANMQVNSLEDIKNPWDGLLAYVISEGKHYIYKNGAFKPFSTDIRINIKDFGAVGDGIHDDTLAFNNWYNYISTNGFTGLIPNGIYLCEGGIAKNSKPFKIEGENEKNTIIKIKANTNKSAFAIYNCDGFSVKNLTIDLNQNTNSSHGLGLYACSSNNLIYENITIKNIGYGGALLYSQENTKEDLLNNIIFKNIKMYGVGNNVDGIHPTGIIGANCNNAIIENSYAENINYYPFEYKNFSSNSYIVNSTAKNCQQGFYLGGDSPKESNEYYCKNINISNCNTIDCKQPFVVGSGDNIKLSDCFSKFFDTEIKSIYGLSIRNSRNIFVNGGNYEFDYLGLDFRNNINCDVKTSLYRLYNDTARFYTLLNCTGDVTINLNTNEKQSSRTLEVETNQKVIINNMTKVDNSEKAQEKILLSCNNSNNLGKRIIEADTLTQVFNSQNNDTPYVRNRYGSDSGNHIDVIFKWDEQKVYFNFYNASTNTTKTKILEFEEKPQDTPSQN